VAVIPHYDNAEGGHHDTRFCYLGERRLAALEAELPDDTHVLGIDEHTGVVLDLDADLATVVGNGSVTVRVRGHSVAYPTGTTVHLDELRFPGREARPVATTASPPARAHVDTPASTTSLGQEMARCEQAFDEAMSTGDATGAARATLELEAAIVAWSADTLQSDEADRARASLRSMIVRLGDAAVAGLRDPAEVLAPLMDVIVAVRTAVRAEKRFDLSDLIRDRVTALGIEVRDTPEGVVWVLEAPR